MYRKDLRRIKKEREGKKKRKREGKKKKKKKGGLSVRRVHSTQLCSQHHGQVDLVAGRQHRLFRRRHYWVVPEPGEHPQTSPAEKSVLASKTRSVSIYPCAKGPVGLNGCSILVARWVFRYFEYVVN